MYGKYEYSENNNEIFLNINEIKGTCFELRFKKNKNTNVRTFALYDQKRKRNVMSLRSKLTKNDIIKHNKNCIDCKEYWYNVRNNLSIFDLENKNIIKVIKNVIKCIECIDIELAMGGK